MYRCLLHLVLSQDWEAVFQASSLDSAGFLAVFVFLTLSITRS